jgi:hypothetical protein
LLDDVSPKTNRPEVQMHPMERLWADVHRTIANSAASVVEAVGAGAKEPQPFYPPGIRLTASEREALRALELSDDGQAALMKVVTSACATPVFQLMCLFDGVADPSLTADSGDVWTGVDLKRRDDDDDHEVLHDEFLESFWTYANSGRPA